MKQTALGPAARRAAATAILVMTLVPLAQAEEWHEAYHAGTQALARGDLKRAVESLRRAIALRPEPGRNVVTYGTNVERRYFPYLRLCEAYLALGELERARDALATSSQWKQEPEDERRQLQRQLDAALEAQRPPPPPEPARPAATPALALPTAAPSTPETAPPSPTPPPTSAPVAEPSVRAPASAAATRPTASATLAPQAAASPRVPPAAPRPNTDNPALGTVEIVSQPPGALAYLDDELLGSTDPETGRLVKSGLPPGRHRVRLALSGHEEAVHEVVVPATGRASVRARLTPRATVDKSLWAGRVGFAALALALVGVVAWMVLRPPQSRPPLWTATPRGAGSIAPAEETPAGQHSPGARRDALGQEWFGDYRLVQLLGRGGMASVYKAERGGELSALKRPLASLLDDSEFVERFLRETEIGRTLNHPNIVRILGRGHVEHVPYFTMELLAGHTVQAFLRSWGAAEARTAASIVAQVAEALDFAHSKGVVHRDLKPSNIMLLPDTTAKVMDFGIARARRFEGLTTTGAFLGTPDYVAPEVVEGKGADARSDLYAVGAIFFELLTGRRPFVGDTPYAVLRKQCTEVPPPPSRLQPGVPPELDAVVARLLAKTPEERPATAEDLVVAVRDWLHGAA